MRDRVRAPLAGEDHVVEGEKPLEVEIIADAEALFAALRIFVRTTDRIPSQTASTDRAASRGRTCSASSGGSRATGRAASA